MIKVNDRNNSFRQQANQISSSGVQVVSSSVPKGAPWSPSSSSVSTDWPVSCEKREKLQIKQEYGLDGESSESKMLIKLPAYINSTNVAVIRQGPQENALKLLKGCAQVAQQRREVQRHPGLLRPHFTTGGRQTQAWWGL